MFGQFDGVEESLANLLVIFAGTVLNAIARPADAARARSVGTSSTIVRSGNSPPVATTPTRPTSALSRPPATP